MKHVKKNYMKYSS